jgi:hypothetical protein
VCVNNDAIVEDDGLFQCKGKTRLLCTEQVLVYIGRPLADFLQGIGGFATADSSGFRASTGAPPDSAASD